MSRQVDRLYVHCKELITLAEGPSEGARRGDALKHIGLVEDGAVAVEDGCIAAVGTTDEIRAEFEASRELDLTGFVVFPGFVDPQVRPVHADAELVDVRAGSVPSMRDALVPVVNAVQRATLDELAASTLSHLEGMAVRGTTTVGATTGYGLEPSSELKCLEALGIAARHTPMVVHGTLLSAHMLGHEQGRDQIGFARAFVDEALATAQERCDAVGVCMGPHGLNADAARVVLEAARDCGVAARVVVDSVPAAEAELALELGASSLADLAGVSVAAMERMAGSDLVAVLLPGSLLRDDMPPPARVLLDHDCAVALATDANPVAGSTRSMRLAMALAVNRLGMSVEECISAATINAAASLGVDSRVGSMHVGKRADLTVLDLPSYRFLGRDVDGGPASLVIMNGEPWASRVLEREPEL